MSGDRRFQWTVALILFGVLFLGVSDTQLVAPLLPLIARESPREYDAWALRWLARWATENAGSAEQAAELAASLAELPAEPAAMATIRALL